MDSTTRSPLVLSVPGRGGAFRVFNGPLLGLKEKRMVIGRDALNYHLGSLHFCRGIVTVVNDRPSHAAEDRLDDVKELCARG